MSATMGPRDASPESGRSATRRVRHRPRTAKSALDGMAFGDRPVERLNRLTPDVKRCAWPACRKPLHYLAPIDGTKVDNRYGVLCSVHAVDVAIAVLQHQQSMQRVQEMFERQTTEQAVRVARWRAEDERYEAEKAALRQDREGFVYYLRVGERIKIGYSVDVKRRMRSYPPGSQLLAVEPGDRDLETQRHRQFAGSRTDGREWFQPTADILELTQEIVGTYGEPKRFAHHFRTTQQPMRHARYG